METEDHLYAYYQSPGVELTIQADFFRPISYRVTEELPAVLLMSPEPHEHGMSTSGFAYEVIGGEFARQVSGGGWVETAFPDIKHYLLVTGDKELEVICNSPPIFSVVASLKRTTP